MKDKKNRETKSSYDKENQLTRIEYPDGTYETFAYDVLGRQTKMTDRNGNAISQEYDKLGRVEAVVQHLRAGGEVRSSMTYDLNGNVLSKTDPEQHTTYVFYDSMSQQTNVVYANGTSEAYVYDDGGLLVQTINRKGLVTDVDYDAIGRMEKTTLQLADGDVVMVTNSYDKVGNKIKVTDANDHATSYYYDQMNRVTNVVFADAEEIIHEYDAVGNKIVSYDENEFATRRGFDPLNRLVAVTNIVSGQEVVESTRYDEVGNVIASVDGEGMKQHIPLTRRIA